MTEKQREILEIIKTFTKENGYSPTVRELCEISNLKSTSTIHGYIKRLKAGGHLTSGEDMPRSIVVTNNDREFKMIVNAIALRREEDNEYILIEENENRTSNDVMLDLPGGAVRKSENMLGCLKRELNDRGYNVSKLVEKDKYKTLSTEEEAVTLIRPFCISENLNDMNSVIVSTIVCEVNSTQARNVDDKGKFMWVPKEDLEDIISTNKDKISAHNISALEFFCKIY